MFSKGQFWIVTIFLALATTILTAATEILLFLWIGGLALFFWVNGRIRETISDNYYINAAYTTLTACVLTVPQIFYGGTVGGWVLYAVCAAYQVLAYFTTIEYTVDYTVGRDMSRNWRSETKSDVQKAYGHLVIAQANWAALILTGLALMAGSFVIASLAAAYSLFFLLLIPVYTFLWNIIALIRILFVGIPVPTGYSWHENVNTIPKGYWFLIRTVLKAIFSVISAPFALIAYLGYCIGNFFAKVKDGGTARLSRFFWICTAVLGVYLIISLFGAADFIERIFGGFNGIDLNINRYIFPITNFAIGLDLDGSFLLDVILAIPKVLGLIVCIIIDLVLLLLVCILWLLINLLLMFLYLILVLCFEAILPAALAAGAVVFLILYLIDSDRSFIDWFRAILFSILPLGAVVFYFLFATGTITLF